MNASRLFIARPVMTTLVMVAIIVFGCVAFFTLPVNDLPAVDFPTIMVQSSLPGANAETMASAVATPLEKQFGTIAGLESMTSTNSFGNSQITLQFSLERNIDGAAQDVQAAIVAARPLLPTSMPVPPVFRKVNPADMPVLYIALSSPTLPLYTVDEYAENMIAPRISMVSGVAQVQVFGSQIYAPHIQIDPRKLSSYGLGIDEVVAAVQKSNVNMPTGTLYGRRRAYNVRVNGQLFNAEAFKPVIVTYRNGSPVRLSDIGTVVDSVQTDKVASWYNNTRAVILAVQRQPGTNTIQIIDNIKTMLPTFRAIMPGAVSLNVLYDRSLSIRKSVADVERTLLVTLILVVAVIFLFLGNTSSTVIASLSLPVSIIGTFAAMKVLGFTVNNISLMALTLCVGFVIDDAIVVLENIVRHMEMGEPPLPAAFNGSREIWFTIISMTLSLVAVFIPVLLLGGIIGRLFFEFGATLSAAILISGFVSLSLTPMLCSRFLRGGGEARRGKLSACSEAAFHWLVELYRVTLEFSLRHRPWVVAMFAAMVLATGYLVGVVPKGFMPTEDMGQIFGMTEASQGISFEEMVRHQKKLAAIVAADPNVQGFMSSVGAGGPNTAGNQGRIFMVLKPQPERKIKKVDDIIQSFRRKTAHIPGIRLFLQAMPSIRVGGHLTKAVYQLTLSGSDTAELYGASIDLEKRMREIPGLVDVNSDLQIKDLQLAVDCDRDRLAKVGVTMQQIQDALNSAYSQRQVGTIYTDRNQYWVLCELLPQCNKDPSMLSWLRIRSRSGQLIPLNAVAEVHRTAGPMMINHLGQFPSVTLSFNLKPGVPLGDAVERVKELARQALPAGVNYSFQGSAQLFESSMRDFGWLLLIAVLVIYIVLGILYESFIHPLTILSGLPSAGLGALITLLVFNMPLDIYGFLGLILLIGIVKKNAIMMIDFAIDHQRDHDSSAEEAIHEACLVRFRPIMMTTMAALLGSLPIATGLGAGGETRQPLGLTIVGGLLVSQLVTLYITPVFYIYLDRLQAWVADLGRRLTRREAVS